MCRSNQAILFSRRASRSFGVPRHSSHALCKFPGNSGLESLNCWVNLFRPWLWTMYSGCILFPRLHFPAVLFAACSARFYFRPGEAFARLFSSQLLSTSNCEQCCSKKHVTGVITAVLHVCVPRDTKPQHFEWCACHLKSM